MTDLAEPATAVIAKQERTEGPRSTSAVPENELRYMGLITRGIAFVIDAALISLVVFLVGAAVALIGSLFHFPHQLKEILAVIGGVAYVLWAAGYFVGFWSATGQTPGDRVMQIRVVTARGERVKPRQAIVRYVGVILATLPLFLGYLPILVDRRRRGLPDLLAGTVVVDAPGMSLAQGRRRNKRAAPDASRTDRASSG